MQVTLSYLHWNCLSTGLASMMLAFSTPAFAETPHHALTIRLVPQVIDGQVDAIEVTEVFDIKPLPAGAELLSLPIVAESVPGVLRDPSTLLARDDAGPLPLEPVDDAADPTQMKQDRHWHTGRPAAGTVTVTYLARPRVVTAATKPAALKDMRVEGAGIHGSTKTLFAIPATGWPRRVHIEWDLAAMAPGSRAVTSFGEGNVDTDLDAEPLTLGYFLAGPWHKLAPEGEDGFLLYYLTPPDFDIDGAIDDAAATYHAATRLFGTEPAPMRAIMRTTARFQGGGTGGRHSFMFGVVQGAPPTQDHIHYLLTHESLHNWIGNLPKGPEGVWFVEGATDYLTAILPYRLGHRSTAQLAARFGKWTTDYYANPRRTMRDDDAAAAFWTDTDAQLLTYSRGPLYVALVDARLRKASGGRRRVDTLLRAMADGIRRGDASEDLWRSLVIAALGEQGRRDFDDMKAGRMLDLPPDLFGPCFRRVARPVGRYRPGLRIDVADDGRHVAGAVQPGSPAATAGLAAGDDILDWRDVADMPRQAGTPLTLRVRGIGGERTLRFNPWESVQDGFTWVEATKPPTSCGL
jgi:predicted metalloprotease with PDZ domain